MDGFHPRPVLSSKKEFGDILESIPIDFEQQSKRGGHMTVPSLL